MLVRAKRTLPVLPVCLALTSAPRPISSRISFSSPIWAAVTRGGGGGIGIAVILVPCAGTRLRGYGSAKLRIMTYTSTAAIPANTSCPARIFGMAASSGVADWLLFARVRGILRTGLFGVGGLYPSGRAKKRDFG